MHLSSSAIPGVLLLAASLGAAAPTGQLSKRELGGILICEGPNATGQCLYAKYALDVCHDIPAPFSRNAATFAPDGEGFYCWPHVGSCSDICTSPTGCTFGMVSFDSPLKYNLTKINWQNLIQSFDCHLNQTDRYTIVHTFCIYTHSVEGRYKACEKGVVPIIYKGITS